MSRADDLFARLSKCGSTALDELLADREPESLFLDFKGSPSDGAGKQLHSDDNKNLSRAISGFANSSGGVVVWGIDCRRDTSSGNEIAQKRPLQDAGGFATKLQNAISRVTIPPHPRVQVTFFDEPNASPTGYVAVLVPQSLIGPIRSIATNHYHLRSGSDFGIVPHDVLAGMFGKPPQPTVDLNLISHPTRIDSRPGHFTLAFGLVAINLGAVVGERPYVSVFFGNIPQPLITVQPSNPQVFSVRRSPLPTFSVIAHPEVFLAPGSTEHMCSVVVDIPTDQPTSISLECTLGILGAPPKRFLLTASIEAIQTGIAKIRSTPVSVQTSELLTLSPQS